VNLCGLRVRNWPCALPSAWIPALASPVHFACDGHHGRAGCPRGSVPREVDGPITFGTSVGCLEIHVGHTNGPGRGRQAALWSRGARSLVVRLSRRSTTRSALPTRWEPHGPPGSRPRVSWARRAASRRPSIRNNGSFSGLPPLRSRMALALRCRQLAGGQGFRPWVKPAARASETKPHAKEAAMKREGIATRVSSQRCSPCSPADWPGCSVATRRDRHPRSRLHGRPARPSRHHWRARGG